MKRICAVLLTFFLCLGLMSFPGQAAAAWPQDTAIAADGGILMDADTGTILYGKNMNQNYYPASITKILTALIVIKNCDLNEDVTFSHDDVYNVEAGSSSAGIDEGDVLTVRDCLYALLLASANESANALACHVSGSREAFADLMNQEAQRLGCTDSHFSNPSGLNDENHYTTAYDMALITREAIKNPTFLEINGARNYQLAPTKRSPDGGYVANHHRMLIKNEPVYYEGAFAGKTGYTSLAGNTLVTCASKNDMTLIAVVLNGHQSHYSDTKALFDFGFGNFQSLKAAEHETTYSSLKNDMTIGGITAQDSISLELESDGRVILPKGADFSDSSASLSYDLDASAPANAIAQVQYSYEGRNTGHVYLLTAAGTAPAAGSTSQNGQAPEGAASNNTAAPDTPSRPDTKAPKQTIPQPAASKSGIGFKLMIGLAVIGLICVVIFLMVLHRRRETAELISRRQRRLDRLEDMGFSPSDFNRLLSQKRSASPSYRPKKPSRRPKQRRRRK